MGGKTLDESKKVREVSPAYGSPGGKLTYQGYCSLPSGHRYELIEGDISMPPSPTTVHQRLSKRIEVGLIEWVESGGLGEVFDIEVASRSGTGLATVRTWGAGCTRESPVLPGFVLDLAALFAGLESV
jgi:hypothetical protein